MTSIASYEQYNNAKIILSSPNDDLYTEEEMQAFLNYASDFLETMAYQPLRLTTQAETYLLGTMYCSQDPQGRINIFPRYFPVNTVTGLTYQLSPGGTETDVSTDGYSIIPGGVGVGPRIILPYLTFSRGAFVLFNLDYTSGYSTATMPGDLVYACCLAAAYFASAGYRAATVQMEDAVQVIPSWAWKKIQEIVSKYGRQF